MIHRSYLIFVFTLLSNLFALQSFGTEAAATPLDRVIGEIHQKLDAVKDGKLIIRGANLASIPVMKRFYEGRAYQPAWSDAQHVASQAKAFLKVLGRISISGLNSDDYHRSLIESLITKNHFADLDLVLTDAYLTLASHLALGRIDPQTFKSKPFGELVGVDLAMVLKQALETRKLEESLQNLEPKEAGYTGLKEALARYRRLAAKGGWGTVGKGPKLKKGDEDERILALRKRLAVEGYLEKNSDGKLFDDALEASLKKFQVVNGITDDGEVGPTTLEVLNVPVEKRVCQLAANLDRWRTYFQINESKYVMVNLPAYTLYVYERDKEIMRMKTVVGRRDRKTPLMSHAIQYLVFSPSWNVPHSIAVKDKLPLIQKDSNFLARNNMRIFEGEGSDAHEVDPASVEWASVTADSFSYRITQKPGDGNALGGVKFMFPNRHNVYLHDTSQRSLFKKTERPFSSGCIRIEKPVELAEYVLREEEKWDRPAIEAAMNRGIQEVQTLKETLPIHLFYMTAWVEKDGALQFRRDLYNYDRFYEPVFCRKTEKKL